MLRFFGIWERHTQFQTEMDKQAVPRIMPITDHQLRRSFRTIPQFQYPNSSPGLGPAKPELLPLQFMWIVAPP